MEDYLYLDDYINLYSKKNNQIMEIIPYKDTLKYGRIINKEKFIKKMITVLNDLKLNKNIFNNNITVIINKNISLSDKEIITDSLEALNYKKVKFINELDYLKLNKNKIYLVYNYHYFYLYYINFLGKTEILMYENNKINKGLILKILK